jgi:hypothetical protein
MISPADQTSILPIKGFILPLLITAVLRFAEDLDASDKPAKEGYQVSPSSRPILAEFSDPEDNLLQAADVTFGQRPVVQGEGSNRGASKPYTLLEARTEPFSTACS